MPGVSARAAVAAYLNTLTEGTVYTAADILAGTGLHPASEMKRRHRELRAAGWVIDTYREDRSLQRFQYRLVRKGR
jgi:hypothetical protein